MNEGERKEGERIFAIMIGCVVGIASLFNLGFAMWNREGLEAILLGTIVVLAVWLARMAYEGLE